MKRFCAAALLFAAVGCADVRYAPMTPARQLPPARIARIDVSDASGGLESAGAGVTLRRPFFAAFAEAVRARLAALGARAQGGEGARVEVVLTKARLRRGAGMASQAEGEVVYAVRVSSASAGSCAREIVGRSALREGPFTSTGARALEIALGKAVDALGPTLESSCLYGASSAAASAPPVRVREDARLYAVVVGVGRYRGASAEGFAARDARDFAADAQALLGAEDDHVAVLTDENATLADLRKHVERWAVDRADAGAELVFYFSGKTAAQPGGPVYLLPYDADPDALPETGFPLTRLFQDLGRLPARVTVVLEATAASLPAHLPANITLLCAGAPGQAVLEDSAARHALFTGRLLDSLRRNSELFAAFDDAAAATSTAARARGTTQTPTRRGGS
ncbi:MAG: caspase family protein [Elusimicrobia bacterium]|nr:caspase family protein [Elusimicrobiota bacterium]